MEISSWESSRQMSKKANRLSMDSAEIAVERKGS